MRTPIYEKIARRFSELVVNRFAKDVDSIILYGSVARNKAYRGSDIDIMVVLSRPNQDVVKNIQGIRDELVFEHGYTISLDFETYDNLRKMLSSGDIFIYNVLEEGRSLWDKNNTFTELRRQASVV